jgi:hypothetical protein
VNVVSRLESLASRLTGKPVSIVVGEEDPLAAALAQLLARDWKDREQVSLLIALTQPRTELRVVEGTEEDEEPEYEEVIIERINEAAAMAMIDALSACVESEGSLFVLSAESLKRIENADLRLRLGKAALDRVEDYEGLQTLAKQLVARVEAAKSAEADALSSKAERLRAQAAALEAQAGNRADESAVSAEKAAQLGQAKDLL